MNKQISIITLISILTACTNLPAHSDAIKPGTVDALVEAYLDIQKALAGDKLPGAQSGAEWLSKVLQEGPSAKDAPSLGKIGAISDKITAAQTIAEARIAFSDLTREMLSLVEHVGTTGQSNIFVAYCPMPISGTSGIWLQNVKDISNPYYGPEMSTCGMIQKQIAEYDDHSKLDH